jgi:hypothetical protein
MLVEVKVKTARKINEKLKKKTETYLVNKEFFSEAEYSVTAMLTEEHASHLIEDFEIQSLRISPIKEIVVRYNGEHTYIATLKDVWLEDDGTEKYLRYKVLLWANNLSEATQHVNDLAREGYDMSIEGVKEVNYILITEGNE